MAKSSGKSKSNRRKFNRQVLGYPAKIIASDKSWGRDCRIADVSDSGARLVTQEPVDLPKEFYLALAHKATRRCELRWTEGCEAGVVFVGRDPKKD